MSRVTGTGWDGDPVALLRAGGRRLADVDPASTPGWADGKDAAKERMKARGDDMSDQQERLFAHGRTGGDRSVLLVLQGMDTAGKGGIVRHVVGMVDPQGVDLRSFGPPTPEEAAEHYLERIRRALPRPGRIGVFDRSHYEDVLAVRVRELVPEDEWRGRYDEIAAFEREVAASGTVVLKVLLHISPREQAARLRRRLERPDKHWKYSRGDIDDRRLWHDYAEAYQDAVDRTDADEAPWFVVPADKKWYARLAVTEILADALASLELGWPEVDVDVQAELARLDAATPPPGEPDAGSGEGSGGASEGASDDDDRA